MPVQGVVRCAQSSSRMKGLDAYGCRISPDTRLSNDYIHNDYKNNHPHPIGDTPMKFHNHEDELQELNRLINIPPSMIVLARLCKGRQNRLRIEEQVSPCT